MRTFPSLMWMMPGPDVTGIWDARKALVETPEKNIYLHNVDEFFSLWEGQHDARTMYRDTRNMMQDLKHPGVEIFCVHGYGIKTLER